MTSHPLLLALAVPVGHVLVLAVAGAAAGVASRRREERTSQRGPLSTSARDDRYLHLVVARDLAEPAGSPWSRMPVATLVLGGGFLASGWWVMLYPPQATDLLPISTAVATVAAPLLVLLGAVLVTNGFAGGAISRYLCHLRSQWLAAGLTAEEQRQASDFIEQIRHDVPPVGPSTKEDQ